MHCVFNFKSLDTHKNSSEKTEEAQKQMEGNLESLEAAETRKNTNYCNYNR